MSVTKAVFLLLLTMVTSIAPCLASRWSSETKLTDYPWLDYHPAITQTQDKKVWILWHRDYYGDQSIFYVTFQGTQKSSEKILIRRNNLESQTAFSTQNSGNYITTDTATFNLTVQPAGGGGGTTDPPPGIYTYPNQSVVSVLAIPNQNYYFDRWVLDPMPMEWGFNIGANPVNVTVDANYTISPIFSTETVAFQHTNPSITQLSNGTIIVVWCATMGSNSEELYYTMSSNGGSNWSNMTRLTSHPSSDVSPAVMQARNGTIWVVWQSYREGNTDIYYKTYNGISWLTDQRLTSDPSRDTNPSIFQTQDNKIWIAWASDRTEESEIYYTTYDGIQWYERRLTEDSSKDDADPTIFQMRNGTIWIMWASYAFPTPSDIYYKVSNDNGNSWSTSSIQFTTDSSEDTSPIAIQTMIPREVWVVWVSNRAEVPDGNWEIWYRKTIVLEGDFNEDEIVDIEDLVIIGLSWGTRRGQPHWNPVADTNDDNAVDIEDLALVGRNYGKTL
jgi:hypothetical protein